MRINGTLINYYFHCKRQCYLHGNRLNLEDNSEQVKIGKARKRIYSVFIERRDVMKSKKQLNYNYAFLFYDVGEKRVQKVFKVCKKYLTHFQKSVFRGEMTPSKFIELRRELNKVINKDEDFVCIIKLMNDNVFGEEILGSGEKDTGETLII